MNGILFDVQRFSVHDGPGIRTTLFFKGCPLHCYWCHNPEGQSAQPQLMYQNDSCIRCRNCTICPEEVHHFTHTQHQVAYKCCTGCGLCTSHCPSGASQIIGRSISAQALLSVIQRDFIYYGADGGVTFSGGECTLQSTFLLDLLNSCRCLHLNTAVDTCGYLPMPVLDSIAECCDLFLYDIKAVTPWLHLQGTGVDNSLILNNYQRLITQKRRIWVRIPVIGGFNASPDEMYHIASFLHAHPGAEQIELLPYHQLGRSKYAQLGRTAPPDDNMHVSRAQMHDYLQLFHDFNLPIVNV